MMGVGVSQLLDPGPTMIKKEWLSIRPKKIGTHKENWSKGDCFLFFSFFFPFSFLMIGTDTNVMLGLDWFAAAAGASTRRGLGILSQGRAVLRRRRRRHARPATAVVVLLGEQVLQPPILHLQLRDAGFQGRVDVVGIADSALESLLALLLLDAESSARGRVASSLVLVGGEPGLFFEAEGTRYAFPGRHGAVLVVAGLPIGRRDR